MLKYFFLLFSSGLLFCQEIHVIYTSALLSHEYDLRKEEYLRSLSQLRSFGFDPWIVEATNISSSFFDSYSTRALYPQEHAIKKNKGVNETMSLRASLPHFLFSDEDIVVKMTGRYFLKEREFLDTVEATANDYDVWGVFGRKHFVSAGDLFTGCFAMRWKYLKKIIEEMDLDAAEREMLAVETIFGRFVRNQHLRVNALKTMHLMTRIFICEEERLEF